MLTGNFCGDSEVGPLPGTSLGSDMETADQRFPPDSTSHRLEGGREAGPMLYFLSKKQMFHSSTGHGKGSSGLEATRRLKE